MAPHSPSTPERPVPQHEQAALLHSIQRRAAERSDRAAQEYLPSSWRSQQGTGDASALLHDLEEDLRLSAKVGSALLEEKGQLEKRLAAAEAGNSKLMSRLTSSVKEAAGLQRKLEEAVGNLEQSESNNRSLLVSLEEDRRTISRLSIDSGKLVSTAAQLKSLTQTHDDLRQELTAERKRAGTAESRVKKQAERVAEMEERLKKAIEDLEEMRQDKVLRTRKSVDALAKVKAKYGKVDLLAASGGEDGLAQNPEAAELLKLVESLVSENDMLRSESQELHELLDVSRDEQSGLRHEMAHREAFAEEAEEQEQEQEQDHDHPADGGRRASIISTSGTQTLFAEVLASPSLSVSASHSFSDFDGSRPFSPSTNATSFNHSLSHSQRGANLSRTLSGGSATSGGEEPSRHTHFHYHLPESRKALKRRSIGGTASSGIVGLGLPPASGRVPVGRGHSRRAMSVDVSSLRSSDMDRQRGDSAPASPNHGYSPVQRPPSLYSVASENEDNTSRPRRHHRPLSLSLGPSLFPLVPEDEAPSPHSASSHRRRPSSSLGFASYSPSIPSGPSGISITSPNRPKRQRQRRATSEERPLVTVDSSTQTSPVHPSSVQPIFHSTPRQPSSSRSHSPQPEIARSNTSTSELSDGDRYLDLGFPAGQPDSRTAVLGTLIDHTAKLLTRIQSADISTQEKRLKKQNLPGDVRHLAQANLKDLLSDIEGLRHHFRRVLEQERATAAREGAQHDPHSAESLVVRRDFVALVKLFRDLLFETSRLRSLVNRVELEPHLASSLRELDTVNVIDLERAPKSAGGLLAPLSRLFAATLLPEPEPPQPKTPTKLRPPPKRSGSSAVSSSTVSVEFGKGAVRRAVATGGDGVEASPDPTSKDSPQTSATIGRRTGSQVKRDLNSIFAGASAANRSASGSEWVTVQAPAPSTNAFGRLLAAYRPALSSTTNAVLDSIPHAPQPDEGYQPTLLERQLRPRGLSDSSIRSTFIAHANPHHRIISPATLALSSEPTKTTTAPILLSAGPSSDTGSVAASPSASGSLTAPRTTGLKHQLSSSLLAPQTLNRKPSSGKLRSQRSVSQLRSVSGPTLSSSPPPPLPTSRTAFVSSSTSPPSAMPISMSPSSAMPVHLKGSATAPQSLAGVSGSYFGHLTSWASKATGLSPLAAAVGAEGDDDPSVKTKGGVAAGRSVSAERARRDFA